MTDSPHPLQRFLKCPTPSSTVAKSSRLVLYIPELLGEAESWAHTPYLAQRASGEQGIGWLWCWVLWLELVSQSKVEDFPVLQDLPVVLAQLLVIVTGVACPSYLWMIFKEYEIHSRDRPM